MDKVAYQFDRIRLTSKRRFGCGEFLSARHRLIEHTQVPQLYDIIDHFGLYVGIDTLASKMIAYELIKRTIATPGHIIEFGVWNGSTLLTLAKLLALMQPATSKLVFGFDNFSGLRDPGPQDGPGAQVHTGKYRGSETLLREAISVFGMEDYVFPIVGDASETIPAFDAAFPEAIVSLAWIDFDHYEPCRVALSYLSKRIAVGGIIVLDEAVMMQWPGETVAMREFLSATEGEYAMEANTLGRQPTMWLTRVR